MQRKLLVTLSQSFSILREYLEDRLKVHTLSARSGRHRSEVKLSHHLLDGILMASTLIRTSKNEDEVHKVSERLALIWRHVDV